MGRRPGCPHPRWSPCPHRTSVSSTIPFDRRDLARPFHPKPEFHRPRAGARRRCTAAFRSAPAGGADAGAARAGGDRQDAGSRWSTPPPPRPVPDRLVAPRDNPGSLAQDFARWGAAGFVDDAHHYDDGPQCALRHLPDRAGWLADLRRRRRPETVRPYLPGGGGHVIITSRNPNWGAWGRRRSTCGRGSGRSRSRSCCGARPRRDGLPRPGRRDARAGAGRPPAGPGAGGRRSSSGGGSRSPTTSPASRTTGPSCCGPAARRASTPTPSRWPGSSRSARSTRPRRSVGAAEGAGAPRAGGHAAVAHPEPPPLAPAAAVAPVRTVARWTRRSPSCSATRWSRPTSSRSRSTARRGRSSRPRSRRVARNWCGVRSSSCTGRSRSTTPTEHLAEPRAAVPHALAVSAHAERLSVDLGRQRQAAERGRASTSTAPAASPRRGRCWSGRSAQTTHAHGGHNPRRSAVVNNLARVLRRLGDDDAAREHFEAAWAIDHAAYGESHPHAAEMANNFGTCLFTEPATSTPPASTSPGRWRVCNARYGSEHPTVASLTNNLGYALAGLGDLDLRRRPLHPLRWRRPRRRSAPTTRCWRTSARTWGSCCGSRAAPTRRSASWKPPSSWPSRRSAATTPTSPAS